MIKICGIRRPEDVEYINEARPDFMGMILSRGFKRTVSAETAEQFLKKLDKSIKRVGVFVDDDPKNIYSAAEKLSLDAVQLHGSENGEYIKDLRKNLPAGVMIWKAVRVRDKQDIINADRLDCDFLLLDSFVKGQAGGTGVTADWDIIKSTVIKTPFFLAGGIGENNLREAMKISENIDLSGSVETEGVKDREKIKRITEIYRRTDTDEQ